ncbi:glycosyltransferase family 1 protein [Anaeromassilibacillus senegalensis]|uniref:Glycosyltransferase family 1 protein n=1 Tax=Anaeromassilibacillus senegalensis TaxID=1673717 RepID=A0ABS9CPF1_9FIRM|nr:glycosyltransferase family 1 protein [Anaeromassilibacillus senegalensis]MCF2652707.1 glycosyltransferase family 1 protein [Anaeromassilibacillus senegalensis]
MEPIRILHVVTYMGRGGLETMVMNYYRHMDRNQIQFDFLVHRDFRADYDDEIESLGGYIYRLPQLIPWSSSYNNALNRFFASHPEYRIVHIHQDCLSSVILKAAKKQGIPVRIAHSHSSSQDKNLKYLIKLFYKRQIPALATQLFACGKEAGDWMFGGAPYHIINNAIDTRKYTYRPERSRSMRQQLGINSDAFVVGHVGRFNTVKNHTFLLDVFAELKKKNRDAVLLLVGEGDLRSEMEKKVTSLGMQDNVIFTGIRSDVPDLMQAMDCFVFPSLYEGIPVTMIEAQASGLPCVISDAVPAECQITSLVERLSLKDGATAWAEEILKHRCDTRRDTGKAIADAGYDIVSNAWWLHNFYLEQWKKEA